MIQIQSDRSAYGKLNFDKLIHKSKYLNWLKCDAIVGCYRPPEKPEGPLSWWHYPDSKVHGANMGPIWGRQDPGGPHVGPMNFAI